MNIKILPKLDSISLPHSNLLYDLSIFLEGYLKNIETKFSFGQQELYLNELFMGCGAFSLFIFDKQEAINQYIEELNKNSKGNYFATIKLISQENDTYFGCVPYIDHNLIINKGYSIDKKLYYDFIKFLAKTILSDKNLSIQNNEVNLDPLYDNFIKILTGQTPNEPIKEEKIPNPIVEVNKKKNKKFSSFKLRRVEKKKSK